MQAIFGWPGNELADWDKQVCVHFPPAGKLSTPWRWRNAGTEGFGQWLLEVRGKLVNGEAVDLNTAPAEVSWVHLDGTEDHARQLRAARTTAPTRDGTVLIIGKSTSPQSQRDFAGKTPGAITVESVDLRDLTDFAKDFDVRAPDALQKLVSFAAKVMINVGAAMFGLQLS